MMRMFITHHRIHKQKGASIVTAIFLIIVLSLMAVGMVSLLATSQQSISQEITSAKTFMAGRSCLQWGMYQAVYNSTTGTHTNTFNNLNSSLYNAECSTEINTITADGLTFYNVTAIANYGIATDPEYSKRTMRLQFQP